MTSQEDVAATIIAMERAALELSDKGDPEGFLAISDPDVVYFDPFLERSIYGLEELRAYYHQDSGGEHADLTEFSNATVQTRGDVAVLTFNYMSRGERSRRINRWNATEVYHRTQDGWRIIHTHWAFTGCGPLVCR